jgi:hypothetical protein
MKTALQKEDEKSNKTKLELWGVQWALLLSSSIPIKWRGFGLFYLWHGNDHRLRRFRGIM